MVRLINGRKGTALLCGIVLANKCRRNDGVRISLLTAIVGIIDSARNYQWMLKQVVKT